MSLFRVIMKRFGFHVCDYSHSYKDWSLVSRKCPYIVETCECGESITVSCYDADKVIQGSKLKIKKIES